ncbi:MAG: sigma 54-interacting transcriptional regulator [Sandaracinaceae bacterium]|nr:sigma 54-interacting transcriptional regulator [Sandaracinaceae bacterium]
MSEIPLPLQVKLLRFLQEREFERVGGNETIRVDVRIVAASNRDLASLVESGEFREDLFYRLNVIRLDVPPLRARKSDVPLLATHFLRRFARENEREIDGFTDEAMRALVTYPWPGNVRELENAIERAVVLCPGDRVTPDLLPAVGAADAKKGEGELGLMIPGLSMAEVERIVIERTLEAVSGSTAKAAEMLGISRRKIQYRLREWSDGTLGSESEEDD